MLGVLAVATVVSAACSSGAGAGSAASTSGTAAASATSQAVRFAQCMRAKGVSNFPDPGPSGQFTIEDIANGSGVDTSSPTFRLAMDACKDLEPPGFTGTTRSPQQQEAALKFAQCIRDNGVTDFPDPGPNSPLIDTNRIPSSATPDGMSALHSAMQKCSDFAAAAGVTGPK